ncbi:MAG: prephenate dehydrogenase [Candidatus Izemoplasma sp.]|nr:prephenate dehydrogenase [Candidatus Izemoplasma sp.]
MTIGIIGLGIIGGSYAKALKPYGYELVGIDIKQETIDYALKHNIVDRGSISAKKLLKDCDIVFVCLYPNQTIDFIKKHINNFKQDAIVVDVAGVKRHMTNQLDLFFNDDINIVLTHPIAGSEKSGISHSKANLFEGANFVITPHSRNKEEHINLIKTLAKQMGFSTVTEISDVDHDKILGFTSQLTHAIAVALVNSDAYNFDTKRFIGDSYKELTRIAMINDELWTELFFENKDFLTRNIDTFIDQLSLIRDSIQNKDKDTLTKLMQKSTKTREDINNE